MIIYKKINESAANLLNYMNSNELSIESFRLTSRLLDEAEELLQLCDVKSNDYFNRILLILLTKIERKM